MLLTKKLRKIGRKVVKKSVFTLMVFRRLKNEKFFSTIQLAHRAIVTDNSTLTHQHSSQTLFYFLHTEPL